MGWIAGLQLFCRSIQGKSASDIRSLAQALSGAESPLYDFLAEEVLGNLDESIVELLIRTSILASVSETEACAVFAESEEPPTKAQVRTWIEDAERLGLLTRSSSSSDARQPHPSSATSYAPVTASRSEDTIRDMHRRVARALLETDPLTAAHHFCEAGDSEDAMHALGHVSLAHDRQRTLGSRFGIDGAAH